MKQDILKTHKKGCPKCSADIRETGEDESETSKIEKEEVPLKVKRRRRGTTLLLVEIIAFLLAGFAKIGGLIGGPLALGAVICIPTGIIHFIAGLVGRG